MPCAERLHITALRSEPKRIDRILQIMVVHAVNLFVRRKNHFSGFHFYSRCNGTVGLHYTAKPDVYTAAEI